MAARCVDREHWSPRRACRRELVEPRPCGGSDRRVRLREPSATPDGLSTGRSRVWCESRGGCGAVSTVTGTATARTAPTQATACQMRVVLAPPRQSARRASTVTVIGLASAKGCSQPGMVVVGTNVELVKISGTAPRMPARPAASGSRTSSPIRAFTQDRARPRVSARPIAASAAAGPAWNRNPTAWPTTITRSRTSRLRTASARARPASAAERAIGRARNRSSMPVVRSSATATPVCEAPNARVSTKMPGNR